MKIKVAKSDIKIIKDEVLVAGSNNCYEITFEFDPTWDKMTNKTAVFYQPSVNRDNPICRVIEDDKVYLSSKELVSGDYLYIGVFGFNKSDRLPTIYTYTYVLQGSYDISKVPNLDQSIYEQIYNMSLEAYKQSQIANIDISGIKELINKDSFFLNHKYEEDSPELESSDGGVIWNVTHNLKTKSVIIKVYESSTCKEVTPNEIVVTGDNTCSIKFDSSEDKLDSGFYKVVIIG